MKRECEEAVRYIGKKSYIAEKPKILKILKAGCAFEIFNNDNDLSTIKDATELNTFCWAWNHIFKCLCQDCIVVRAYLRLVPPTDWGKTSNTALSNEILDLLKPE